MKSIKDESGQALVLVMMIITLILIMSSSMLTQGSESHKASFEERKIVQANYIAEAGVEKTIAEIKNDPFRLKGLTLNANYTYLSSMIYAGGQITSVIVRRTSSTANPTTFYIESLGEYQGAKRTIQVQGKMYDPVDFPTGVWIRSPQSQFGDNCIVDADVTAEGNLTFTNNCQVLRNITASGDVTLWQNMLVTKITTGRDLIINNYAQVAVDVDAARDVLMDNNTGINGVVNAVRNINVGSGAMIGYETQDHVFNGKDAYFNGTITNNGLTGTQHHGGAHAVNVSTPPFPALDQSWYAKNADQLLTGNLSGTFSVDGISYISRQYQHIRHLFRNWYDCRRGKGDNKR